MVRDLKKLKYLKVYAVRANQDSGECLEIPYPTGEIISADAWLKQEDLSDVHFTTFNAPGDEPGKEITRALLVNWVDTGEPK